nr:HAMP domain-containing sensor histidine kinase [Micromonospora sp. DSM 115978]
TPLTALRLEAESLADPAEAERLTGGVDGLERAVSALIRQARWRSDTDHDAQCDAAEVVRSRVAFWSVLAEDTGRDLTTDLASGPLLVRLPADELSAAVDALLGNVFAHTPDGTGFAVTVAPTVGGAGATVVVSDDGPGLAGNELGRGVSDGGSTGLGLDIARQAEAASGGTVELGASGTGGARILLRLGGDRPA